MGHCGGGDPGCSKSPQSITTPIPPSLPLPGAFFFKQDSPLPGTSRFCFPSYPLSQKALPLGRPPLPQPQLQVRPCLPSIPCGSPAIRPLPCKPTASTLILTTLSQGGPALCGQWVSLGFPNELGSALKEALFTLCLGASPSLCLSCITSLNPVIASPSLSPELPHRQILW